MRKFGESKIIDVMQHRSYGVYQMRKHWFSKYLGKIWIPDSYKGKNFDFPSVVRKGIFFTVIGKRYAIKIIKVEDFTYIVQGQPVDFGGNLKASLNSNKMLLEWLVENSNTNRSVFIAEIE